MSPRTIGDVGLARSRVNEPPDLGLWQLIDDSTRRLSFDNYDIFMNHILCREEPTELRKELRRSQVTDFGVKVEHGADAAVEPGNIAEGRAEAFALRSRRHLPFTDTDAYRLLKVATEAFLMVNCGVKSDAEGHKLDQPLDPNSSVFGRVDVVPASDDAKNKDFPDFWNKYRLNIPDEQNVSGPVAVLPLLAIIAKKLPGSNITPPLPKEAEPEVIACLDIVQEKLTNPCLVELIWSYWQEEGMLVQTMNAITRRFQNIRSRNETDPLAMLEIGNLRPLSNLLWGYLQDEQHRLSVMRRAMEYDHHYGIALQGKAVGPLRPADSRSKFLEAFHNLLYLCTVLFRQDDDTTVKADGFPVLEAVKDLQLVLTEGQHNQFGDLPSAARIEMLMQQWLLARPEFREFLPTRESVAYPERWMERVDAMKKLQGWGDTSVRHFSTLAEYGERILLSIRYGAWSDVDDGNHALVWARYFRPAIQSYVYAYQAVTGVNLAADAMLPQQRKLIVMQPSELLRRRLPGSAVPQLPEHSSAAQPVQGYRARRSLPRR